MSNALQAISDLRCIVCSVKSALTEQERQSKILQCQAALCANVAEQFASQAKCEEAKHLAQSIAAEILWLYGEGET